MFGLSLTHILLCIAIFMWAFMLFPQEFAAGKLVEETHLAEHRSDCGHLEYQSLQRLVSDRQARLLEHDRDLDTVGHGKGIELEALGMLYGHIITAARGCRATGCGRASGSNRPCQ